MKKSISLLLVFVFLLLAVGNLAACKKEEDTRPNILAGDDLFPGETAYVKWEGRHDQIKGEGNDPAKVTLYHTASGFTVEFEGTALYVEFESEIAGNSEGHYPYYNVAVDDETLPNPDPSRTFHLTGGPQRIAVVEGLSEGKHTVTCLKMSEPHDAITSIRLLETDGRFEARDVEYDKGNLKFMMICASGGSGYGSLAYSDDGKGSMGRNTANSSSLHAFTYLTARLFGADVQFVSNGGWGVSFPQKKSIYDVLDYSGITTSNNVEGALTTGKWDHASWVPDVIIFNIGGNDTTQSGFDQGTYQKEVVAMVEKMHALYPNAYMIWTHTSSNAGKYAISAMNDAGILKAGYMKEVIIPKVGVDGTVGASNHNSMVTHIATAEIIADALTTAFGFNRLRENIKFEEHQSFVKPF